MRAARALAALKIQDAELSKLKEELVVVETGKNSGSSHREEQLEKRLNQAESKVTKLTAQLEANRRTSSKLTDEKLELQGWYQQFVRIHELF